ncbi:MAG: ferrous iron transport protein A [Gammaproteobacteria bacterium]|nr:ferrous iron transport protein A [Gammaproteobacteria bacterium]
MTLDQLKKGQFAQIKAIKASKELKNRFISFGLVKGAKIYIESYSLAKKTIEVRINNTRLAIRATEAKKVEVI